MTYGDKLRKEAEEAEVKKNMVVPGHRQVLDLPGYPFPCECGHISNNDYERAQHLEESARYIAQGHRQACEVYESTSRIGHILFQKLMEPRNIAKAHWRNLTTDQLIQYLRNEYGEVGEILDGGDPDGDLAEELIDLIASAMMLWERLKGLN